MNIVRVGILLTMILVDNHNCLQVILERANFTYLNPKYFEYGKIYVKRYGRRSPYYLNIEAKMLHQWGNNVTLNLIFYEYLHNEYRRSFVEMHFKFCDMISNDPYIGAMLKAHGISCPNAPGEYKLLNMSLPTDNFDQLFPFEKCKVQGEITSARTGEQILRGDLYALLKPGKMKKY